MSIEIVFLIFIILTIWYWRASLEGVFAALFAYEVDKIVMTWPRKPGLLRCSLTWRINLFIDCSGCSESVCDSVGNYIDCILVKIRLQSVGVRGWLINYKIMLNSCFTHQWAHQILFEHLPFLLISANLSPIPKDGALFEPELGGSYWTLSMVVFCTEGNLGLLLKEYFCLAVEKLTAPC